MAKKPNPERTSEQDLAALEPDMDVDVRHPETGEAVTLRARRLRALQGWKASPIINRMAKPLCEALGSDDPVIGLSQVIADHADDFLELVMLSTGEKREFLEALDAEDMMYLTDAVWVVNSSFFVQSTLRTNHGRALVGKTSDSRESSTSSSGPDTAREARPESSAK